MLIHIYYQKNLNLNNRKIRYCSNLESTSFQLENRLSNTHRNISLFLANFRTFHTFKRLLTSKTERILCLFEMSFIKQSLLEIFHLRSWRCSMISLKEKKNWVQNLRFALFCPSCVSNKVLDERLLKLVSHLLLKKTDLEQVALKTLNKKPRSPVWLAQLKTEIFLEDPLWID